MLFYFNLLFILIHRNVHSRSAGRPVIDILIEEGMNVIISFVSDRRGSRSTAQQHGREHTFFIKGIY